MKNYTQKVEVDTKRGTVQAFKIKNNINGNPRWVIHYLDLFDNFENKYRLKYGLHKYRAKWFGGGYVTTSYDIESKIKQIVNEVYS